MQFKNFCKKHKYKIGFLLFIFTAIIDQEVSNPKNAIKITMPKVDKTVIDMIDVILKKKGFNHNIKHTFETATVKDEKLNDYLDQLILQLGLANDEEEKASLKKLLFVDSGKIFKSIANEKNSKYSTTLI